MIKIAEDVYDIILDSIATVVKAVSWVLSKVGVLLDKLIDFLGFLFNWDDVLDTTDSLTALLNAGLDYGERLLEQTEPNVKNWLENLKKMIKSQVTVIAAYGFGDVGADTKSQQKKQIRRSEQDSEAAVKGGVAYNWPSYQLTYGGAASSGTVNDSLSKSKLQ